MREPITHLLDVRQLHGHIDGKNDTIEYLSNKLERLKAEYAAETEALKAARDLAFSDAESARAELYSARIELAIATNANNDLTERTYRLSDDAARWRSLDRALEEVLHEPEMSRANPFGASTQQLALDRGSDVLDLSKIPNLPENFMQFTADRLSSQSENFKRFYLSRADLAGEIYALERDVRAMKAEMEKAGPLYRPTKFWDVFSGFNMEQLHVVGVSNFKLTVNQNYQNFVPTSYDDPKIKPLLVWFLNNPSVRPLLGVIDNPDGLQPFGYLNDKATWIFKDNRDAMALYRAFVMLGWEFCLANDPLGICRHIFEPQLGNPICVWHDGRLVSQDMATSVVEVTRIMQPLAAKGVSGPVSVLEIGGGAGRLAHALMVSQPISKYIIVDIPPTLHVSQWYLGQLFPDKKHMKFRPFAHWDEVAEEAAAADVIYLLPHQIEHLPDDFVDTAVAVSSLHEMLVEQANNYLTQMGRIARHQIYSKQYWSYDNPYDQLVIRHEDYKIPAGYHRVSVKDDLLNPAFFTDILHRKVGQQNANQGNVAV